MIPENVKRVEYAVRGPLVARAEEIEKSLRAGAKLPFERITYCNMSAHCPSLRPLLQPPLTLSLSGNPQQLGQAPLSYVRQTLALLEAPELMDQGVFPPDIVARSRRLLISIDGGSTGAYTQSKGLPVVREEVARFIARRDGVSSSGYADPESIFLSDGASPAVQATLRMLIRGSQDGILIPIPQYPLYSATIPLLGGTPVPYYLDEARGWALDATELQRAVTEARGKGLSVRGLVVINPGNPTGSVLPRQNMVEIVSFCEKEGIVLMADEVYQENVYGTRPWASFKKVAHDLGSSVELMSYHSVSKGIAGECGKRGGYVEMHNIAPEVRQEYLKLVSISLCPNVLGQCVLAALLNPPLPGDVSYPRYLQERTAIYDSLKRRAELIVTTLNQLPGVSCQPAEGAMYAFPQITLPEKAQAAARALGRAPDAHYCFELLEATGLCVVPGSGFGQRPGTWHFRTTFLPAEPLLRSTLARFAEFHKAFLAKYQ